MDNVVLKIPAVAAEEQVSVWLSKGWLSLQEQYELLILVYAFQML